MCQNVSACGLGLSIILDCPFNPLPHIDAFWCLCSRWFENIEQVLHLFSTLFNNDTYINRIVWYFCQDICKVVWNWFVESGKWVKTTGASNPSTAICLAIKPGQHIMQINIVIKIGEYWDKTAQVKEQDNVYITIFHFEVSWFLWWVIKFGQDIQCPYIFATFHQD